jgi:hypothetical protein
MPAAEPEANFDLSHLFNRQASKRRINANLSMWSKILPNPWDDRQNGRRWAAMSILQNCLHPLDSGTEVRAAVTIRVRRA